MHQGQMDRWKKLAVSARRLVAAVASLACFMAIALYGCSPGDDVAARAGDIVVAEDEVTAYTAAYRESVDAEDDEAWARYLRGQGYDAKAWREHVIREIVGKRLVEKRADELSIVADQERVDSALESAQAGSGADDGAGGGEDAESEGASTGSRADFEYASILEQVLLEEGASSIVGDEETLQNYIEQNLMDRVVKRLSVLSFAESERDKAEQALDELKALSGDMLETRFDELVAERALESEAFTQGDIGWSLLYDINSLLDPDAALALRADDLYPYLVERDEGWQVCLCTDRFVFDTGVSYADIKDESLRDAIARAYLVGSWSSWSESYLAQLVDDAQVQVTPVPDDAPYDVDDIIANLDT